jgi:hypothetical protein
LLWRWLFKKRLLGLPAECRRLQRKLHYKTQSNPTSSCSSRRRTSHYLYIHSPISHSFTAPELFETYFCSFSTNQHVHLPQYVADLSTCPNSFSSAPFWRLYPPSCPVTPMSSFSRWAGRNGQVIANRHQKRILLLTQETIRLHGGLTRERDISPFMEISSITQ